MVWFGFGWKFCVVVKGVILNSGAVMVVTTFEVVPLICGMGVWFDPPPQFILLAALEFPGSIRLFIVEIWVGVWGWELTMILLSMILQIWLAPSPCVFLSINSRVIISVSSFRYWCISRFSCCSTATSFFVAHLLLVGDLQLLYRTHLWFYGGYRFFIFLEGGFIFINHGVGQEPRALIPIVRIVLVFWNFVLSFSRRERYMKNKIKKKQDYHSA